MPTFAKASAGKDGKNTRSRLTTLVGTRHTLLAHRDSFLAKVPRQVAGVASGNRLPRQSGSSASRRRLARRRCAKIAYQAIY